MSKKGIVKDLARQRIRWLFNLAVEETRKGRYERAKKYTELIMKIAEKSNIKIPRLIKRNICSRCGVVLIPGITLSIRLRGEGRGSHVTARCMLCGWIKRYYIKVRRA